MTALRIPGLVLVAGVLAACGGSGGHATSRASPASLPRALATELAARADAVAAALERGDRCQAYRLGRRLAERVAAARRDGGVPFAELGPLSASVTALERRLSCPPPPPQEVVAPKVPPGQAKKQDHEKPKKDRKKEKHGHGKGGP